MHSESCFIVKKNGANFTSEPNNLTQLNTYKYSGLANAKTVGVSVNKGGKVEVAVKKNASKVARKPASSYARNQLSKHMVKKSCRAAESLRNATAGQFYRGDLADAAVARYHALYKSLKVDPSADKKQKRRRGNKA